jgi:hypothetical protein
MESANYQGLKNFLIADERKEILDYVDFLKLDFIPSNPHLRELIGKLNGMSYMFDLSRNEISSKISDYQSSGSTLALELPPVFHRISQRIADAMNISNKNSFLQIVNMNEGGIIGPHYDASFDCYINYKCNISVLSETYDFRVDDELVVVEEGDLYCFEASLYKHWTPNPFSSRRVLLSFGFMLEYADLGRSAKDPRVRLSKRIEKYFQNSGR